MVTPEEVEAAVRRLVGLLASVDPEVRARLSADRTVSCRLPDLDLVWSGRLCNEGLMDVTDGDAARAQVRVSVDSDDLVALVDGRLAVPLAMATGRLRVQASPLDLLRLRALL